MKICVIGAGPAGIITTIAICNKLNNKNLHIDVYDPGEFFCGRSFNTKSRNMLLNTSVGVSFICPKKRDGIIRYLKNHHNIKIKKEDVVPRDLVVDFFKSEFQLARKRVKYVKLINAKVDDIHVDNRKPYIHHQGEITGYDAVVIATGLHFMPPPEEIPHDNIISVYPAKKLTEIDKEASVLVLGSRLSAVDALVHLAGCRHKGPVNICSRSQLFPSVRHHSVMSEEREFYNQYLLKIRDLPKGYSWIAALLELFETHLSSQGVSLGSIIEIDKENAKRQLEADVKNCHENKNLWEDVVMELIDCLNYAWPRLSRGDKERFNKEVNPWFSRIISSMPLCNAEIILELFNKGQLRMLKPNEVLSEDISKYDVVVNATGLQPAEADLFLSQAESKDILHFNGSGGVHVDIETHRLQHDIPVYANGSIVQGDVFTANSIYSTSYGAEKIASDMILL